MITPHKIFFTFLSFHFFLSSFAQSINHELLQTLWQAQWITHPSAALKNYEVFHFRKIISLPEKPQQFIVHISADSRYKFYVNGRLVDHGPARSDLAHWNFETYDLAPYLQAGNNLLAAVVWNQGEYNGLAQHSYRTAFIMQGNGDGEAAVNTGAQWKVYKNEAYTPIVFKPVDPRLFWQYYVAGALDSVQASLYPWQWETINFDDSQWRNAKIIGRGTPIGPENHTMWDLMPRQVAMLESTPQRFNALRKATGMQVTKNFPHTKSPLVIPANTKVSLLLDTRFQVTGYPQLTVSGGKNSLVKISYAETLVDADKQNPHKFHKSNRDEVEGKMFIGVYDAFLPDGGANRIFIPLWMRVFRYVQLEIETREESLTIDDLSYDFTLYPFKNEASFTTDDLDHARIMDASLRTIRLASQETYIDPYYEQMQYIGDTRIQALFAYYHFRDDRLTINAIKQFDWSRSPDGITMSRYPSSLPQYTPLYALCWMLMVNDYWMLRNDENLVRQFIPGMLQVLSWFEGKIDKEGMLGNLPYLDFLDSHYDRNKILGASESKSLTPYSLFYVYTVQQLKALFHHFGRQSEMAHHEKVANGVKQNVINKCYDAGKGMFAENPEKKFFSQHSNIMAILTNCISPSQQKQLMQKMLTDTSLLPVSLYFKFYQFAALEKAGMADDILNQLGDWKAMLKSGMHTFSEWLNDPRSECHSWSAYPAYYFLKTIAGIQPAEAGFKTVLIEPHVGALENIAAYMPHSNGSIRTSFQKQKNGQWKIAIELPKNTPGQLRWKGKSYTLKTGQNNMLL